MLYRRLQDLYKISHASFLAHELNAYWPGLHRTRPHIRRHRRPRAVRTRKDLHGAGVARIVVPARDGRQLVTGIPGIFREVGALARGDIAGGRGVLALLRGEVNGVAQRRSDGGDCGRGLGDGGGIAREDVGGCEGEKGEGEEGSGAHGNCWNVERT